MNNPAPIGHNRGPTLFDEVSEQLETVNIEASNWLDGKPIENQAQADEIGKLIDRIRTARKEADEARKTEAKPFDDGKKEVQARYKPLLTNADTMLDGCKKLLAPFLAKLEAVKRVKEAEARRIAEEKQREAEEAALAADATDLAAREDAEWKIQAAKRAAAEARAAEKDHAGARGGGRAVTLRTVYVPEITDMRTVARHYWKADRQAVDEFFRELVAKDVRDGKWEIPGVAIREEKVAQ